MKLHPSNTLLGLSLGLALSITMGLSTAHAADDVREACKEDAKTLCKGIKPGGGRIAACLKEHKEEVSAECKEAVKDHHGDRPRRPGRKGGDEN